MTDNEILAQVKIGIDLFLDKTYEVKDLYGHILQIIRENSEPAHLHKQEVERLLFKVNELRKNQRAFLNNRDKSKLGICRTQEADIDKLTQHLLLRYSIEKFKAVTSQAKMFQ